MDKILEQIELLKEANIDFKYTMTEDRIDVICKNLNSIFTLIAKQIKISARDLAKITVEDERIIGDAMAYVDIWNISQQNKKIYDTKGLYE